MSTNVFNTIPSNLFAYWLSKEVISNFQKGTRLGEIADARNGFTTGNNDLFLRLWYEIEINKAYFNATDLINAFYTGKKWFPYNKGGEYRKWYGNQDYLINWFCDGKEIKEYNHLVPRSINYMFYESVSWSKISSGNISFRFFPNGFMFDVAGLSMFFKEKYSDYNLYIMGFLNSDVCQHYLRAMSPTLNYETGQISYLPIILEDKDCVSDLVSDCKKTVQEDWDSFETSWGFKKHPLI